MEPWSVYVVDGRQEQVVAPQLEREMRRLRAEHGPVIRATLPFGGDGWLAIGHRSAGDLMSHPGFSTARTGSDVPRMRENGGHRPPWPRSLSVMDPPEHTAKRRLLAKHLTPKRVMLLEPGTAAHARALVTAMRKKGRGVDAVADFAELLPLAVLCDLLGVPFEERDSFVPQAQALVAGRVDDPAEGERLILGVKEYFGEVLDRRRRAPGDDLLSAMIHDTETAGVWSEDDLQGIGFSLLAAGHDATTAILGGALYWLAHSPELYQRLRDDPDLLRDGLEEFLRYLPAGTGSRTRVAQGDIEIAGTIIPDGEGALPWVHAANFDESVFDDPLTFDIERTPNPHLRFGLGAHACPGQHLARMEIRVAIRAVLEEFPRFQAANPVPEWRERVLLRGPRSLPITW